MTTLDQGKYRLPGGRTKLLAHDVRHLCKCPCCDGIADDREGIQWKGQEYHPVCFYRAFGRRTTLELLPRSEQLKFRLSDVPLAVMKTLIRYIENDPATLSQ